MFDQYRAERVGVKQKRQRQDERFAKKQMRRGFVDEDEDEEDRSDSNTEKE